MDKNCGLPFSEPTQDYPNSERCREIIAFGQSLGYTPAEDGAEAA